MKQMIIHLATDNLFGLAGKEQCIKNFKSNRYLQLPPVEHNIDTLAFVPEEAFDLTNNPYRQDERMKKYGNGRSVSVGDIVEVEGRCFLCLSMGWEEFKK